MNERMNECFTHLGLRYKQLQSQGFENTLLNLALNSLLAELLQPLCYISAIIAVFPITIMIIIANKYCLFAVTTVLEMTIYFHSINVPD